MGSPSVGDQDTSSFPVNVALTPLPRAVTVEPPLALWWPVQGLARKKMQQSGRVEQGSCCKGRAWPVWTGPRDLWGLTFGVADSSEKLM